MSERFDCCGSDQQIYVGMTGSIGAVNGSNNAATADKSNCLWLEKEKLSCLTGDMLRMQRGTGV